MADIDPLVFSYGLMAAACFLLAFVLAVGAWRNHFQQHRVRPIIWALAYLFGVFGLHAALRLWAVYLRTSGAMADYLTLLVSPLWYWMTNAATLGVVAVAFTMLLAYPASRNKR